MTTAIPFTRLNKGDDALPTLVCIPGTMCSPQVFAACAAASGMNAIALHWMDTAGPHDLDSIAARIVASIASIADMPRVMLVGHSLGTPLAMLTALREWQGGAWRIEGLVLSNSGANTRGHGDVDALIAHIHRASTSRPRSTRYAASRRPICLPCSARCRARPPSFMASTMPRAPLNMRASCRAR